MKKMGNKMYISGPMSGYENYNKEAFSKAAKYLVDVGVVEKHEVVNPHDLHTSTDGDREDYMRIDLQTLIDDCCAIYMLEGWQASWGAVCEYVVARELNYRVYFQNKSDEKLDCVSYPPAMTYGPPVSICAEAENLVYGARQNAYNHPLDNFTQIADMLNALWKDRLLIPLDAHDIAPMMIVTKLSRHSHARKRDNLVDIAGYAETDNLVSLEKERRGI